ncbi:hypothetical protein T06_6897 [Trichinella sp. T6]|nr:hypothetical protein T06_6897 [Trichinella sp. T6]
MLEIRLVAPRLLSIRTCVHGYCNGLRLNSSASHFPQTPPLFCDWLYSDRLHAIDRLCNVPFDLLSCVKLYAQQHFTSCFIVYFSLTPLDFRRQLL